MKLLLLSILFLCYFSVKSNSSVTSDIEKWKKFKITYNKVYENELEENYRRDIFFKNLKQIQDHNKKYNQGLVTYTVAINHFADRTVDELTQSSQPLNIPKGITNKKVIPKTEVPESIDWRDYGVITPIVDQNFCLSCWAFAVVTAIEGHIGIHLDKKNQTLSQENLIDCVYTDFECKQEMKRTALEDCYKYIIANGGIATSKSYPYDQSPSECRFKPEDIGATIQGYGIVTEGDEEELKRIVGTLGPVSVIITVDLTFMVYRKGVYYNENCENAEEPYNHAVTVTGYGVKSGQDFWLVRNEWGRIFGDHGYIKMTRNRRNNCGIATYASYPIIKKEAE